MLRLGCCCYICKRWFLLILRRAFCPLEGGGGGQTYWHQAYNIMLQWLLHPYYNDRYSTDGGILAITD